MLDAIDWEILIWLIAGVVAGVGELLTGTFFLLPLVIGAFAAAVAAALGANLMVVVVVFVVVTVLAFVVVIRVGIQWRQQPAATHEGAGRYIGVVGSVTVGIDPAGQGRVRLGDETWRAVSATGEPIDAGSRVRVKEIKGTALVVEPA